MADHEMHEMDRDMDRVFRTLVQTGLQGVDAYARRRVDQERQAAEGVRESARERMAEEVKAERLLGKQQDAAAMIYRPLMDDRTFDRASPERVATAYMMAEHMRQSDPRAAVAAQWLDSACQARFGVSPTDLGDQVRADRQSPEGVTPSQGGAGGGPAMAVPGEVIVMGSGASSSSAEQAPGEGDGRRVPDVPEFWRGKPATEDQVSYLQGACGVSNGEGLTRYEAHMALSIHEGSVMSLSALEAQDLWRAAESAKVEPNPFSAVMQQHIANEFEETMKHGNPESLETTLRDVMHARDDMRDVTRNENTARVEESELLSQAAVMDAGADNDRNHGATLGDRAEAEEAQDAMTAEAGVEAPGDGESVSDSRDRGNTSQTEHAQDLRADAQEFHGSTIIQRGAADHARSEAAAAAPKDAVVAREATNTAVGSTVEQAVRRAGKGPSAKKASGRNRAASKEQGRG